ncbi:MAG: PIN domain-containing protein [Magnetococcus sp. DMHC-1]
MAELLYNAAARKEVCYGCFISLMEILYRVWKDEGEFAGRKAYAECLAFPVNWIHESTSLLETAARIKANHSLSLADSWIVAAAVEVDAILMHKDPEFENIPGLREERLPYK